MLSSLVITLRETLEAALVVGIVLAFLKRTNRARYVKTVWLAVLAAVVASGVFALLFTAIAGEFTGTAEMVFEGTTMLFAAVLLTVMIFAMLRRNAKGEIEAEVEQEVERNHKRGVFLVVFAAVFREGVETVIFLAAAATAGASQLLGGLLGAIIAVLIGYGIFAAALRVNLRKFFAVTSAVLLLFAAGLVLRGVGEYQEARIAPGIVEHVWDINPTQNADGTYPALHEEGVVGSVLRDLFGYTAAPSLTQLVCYLAFLGVVGWQWRKAHVAL